MKDLIIEQIERRARVVEHGDDVNKAAAEYFRDYPKSGSATRRKSLA